MNRLYRSPVDQHNGVYLGHWKLGLHTGKLSICPRARKLFEGGMTKQAGLQEVFDILSRNNLMTLIRAFKSAIRAGSNLDVEIQLLTPAGNTKWIRIIGTLSYRRWGVPDQFVGTIEDITQQWVEENLNLSLVEHEIRNPLSIIKLNTELAIKLMEPHQDQRQVRLLSMVDEHVNGITSVLDEYLSTKINEQRQIALNLTDFDLHHVLNKLISEMQVLHRHNRFERLYAGEMWVKADKNRIVRVLINYLTNAVKFSDHSSVIKISSVIKDNCIEVCITDQGIGIPKGFEEMIFEKYFICPDRKGRQQNSKGLGLHVVKSIINAHGGKVRAEQIKNGGTAFYFSVPTSGNGKTIAERKMIA